MNKQITRILPERTRGEASRTKFYLTLLGIFVAVFLFSFLTTKFKDNRPAGAVSLSNFEAGYIISDWQMTNYNSMSESEIQAFLESKNACNNRDRALYEEQSSRYPGLKWHWEDGHFVCLAQEKFGDGTELGTGASAAHIIWQAAQDYRINPQVLIVLLEKENGLITDDFPHSGQYKTATGFGCPDTAPCEAQYFGFKNQIRKAAALYREVMDGGWTNYPVGMNYVRYNPSAACGGTMVDIRNRATSALYRYTPYQPNASALAAGHGTGDSCGAYGNRNFYLYFEEWFGGIKNTEASSDVKEPEPSQGNAKPLGATTITEGVYVIHPAVNNSMTVDVDGGETANSTNVQIYENNGTGAQKWQVEKNSDGTYTFVNPQARKALDVDGADMINETNVQIYEKNGTCAQKWTIKGYDDGTYSLLSACSSEMALDLYAGQNRNGANVQIYSAHGGESQRWKLEKTSDTPVKVESSDSDNNADVVDDGEDVIEGYYQIVSKAYPGETIDIKGGVAATGELISFSRRSDNNDNQVFEIRYDESDGYYNIINPASGSAFDVRAANSANGTPVDVYPLHSLCHQDWSLERDDDGYYTIRSRCSNKVLDLSGTTHGIIIYESHGGNNQKWQLRSVD